MAKKKKHLKLMDEERIFPKNTCPSSRYVAMLARDLAKGKVPPNITEEPEEASKFMAAVVQALWSARTALLEQGYTWTITDKGKVKWTK